MPSPTLPRFSVGEFVKLLVRGRPCACHGTAHVVSVGLVDVRVKSYCCGNVFVETFHRRGKRWIRRPNNGAEILKQRRSRRTQENHHA